MRHTPYKDADATRVSSAWHHALHAKQSIQPTEPEEPTPFDELSDMLWRWWELHQQQLYLIEETRKRKHSNQEENNDILAEIHAMHTAKWMLQWGLSADAREILCSYRRVSLPGVQFEFCPDPDASITDKPMDQLSAFPALNLQGEIR
jgi:hypothetical protein